MNEKISNFQDQPVEETRKEIFMEVSVIDESEVFRCRTKEDERTVDDYAEIS